MQQGLKTGLIAFAVLTYLILVGLPERIGELAFPILAVITALLFTCCCANHAKKRRPIGC